MIGKKAYCVILAGGKGRRLWPCSREEKPKQFDDFFGTGRTQLQQTFDRFSRILPAEHIFVITNTAYTHLVSQQLPELPPENLLSEPVHRNTAPSVAWVTHRIAQSDPDACLLVTPSDQAVFNAEAFDSDVERAFDLAWKYDGLICMGIRPTRPEPGYGYIQMGRQMENELFAVKSFTEKPEREFARMFMQSGEFYWNTGIFVANLSYLRDALEQVLPFVWRDFELHHPQATHAEEQQFMAENFSRYPNLSLERGILEHQQNAYLMVCDFGWADLGTWHSIYEAMQKAPDENVAIDSDVWFENARGNIVKLPHGRFAVIDGLEGFIVAEQGNVLLICRKEDSSALVRKYAGEVALRKGEDFV